MNHLLSRALSEGDRTFCLVFFGAGAAATLAAVPLCRVLAMGVEEPSSDPVDE